MSEKRTFHGYTNACQMCRPGLLGSLWKLPRPYCLRLGSDCPIGCRKAMWWMTFSMCRSICFSCGSCIISNGPSFGLSACWKTRERWTLWSARLVLCWTASTPTSARPLSLGKPPIHCHTFMTLGSYSAHWCSSSDIMLIERQTTCCRNYAKIMRWWTKRTPTSLLRATAEYIGFQGDFSMNTYLARIILEKFSYGLGELFGLHRLLEANASLILGWL